MIQTTPQYAPIHGPCQTVPTQMDCLADDIARQMAFSKLTRRGSRHSAITPVKSRMSAGGPVRIAKGRSAGNSPRTLERRKTTIEDSRRRPTLSDHFEYMFGLVDGVEGGEEEEEEEEAAAARSMRPTSWHPSSQKQQQQHQQQHQQQRQLHQHQQQQQPQYHHQHQHQTWPASRPASGQFNLDDHSIYLNTTSFPAPSLYSYSSGISPISSPSPSIIPFDAYDGQGLSLASDDWYASKGEKCFQQYVPLQPSRLSQPPALQISSGFSCDASSPSPYASSDWPYPPALPLTAATSPVSPNFLPIQQPDYLTDTPHYGLDDIEHKPEQECKELVGMGLYDKPDASTFTLTHRPHSSSNLLTHPFELSKVASGQGLKLEETWQPPEGSDEEDNDNDSGVDDSPEDAVASHHEYPASLPADLSSTSFLLSSDGFLGDEALLSAASMTEPKAQDAGLQHYGWI
ncbi:MAG: hypothetical protein M1829_004187 [Trizodia sp. TS-e1964]|nr:MAG: hypothetical protein M1829_004187 [Trizodia sp. TS-e1964]